MPDCPPYSYCQPSAAARRTLPFYYLARLRLAAGTAELLPHQLPALTARTAALWEQFRYRTHYRRPVPAAQARRVGELLLERLLARPCCRRALRRAVPLTEALGPLAQVEFLPGPAPLWHDAAVAPSAGVRRGAAAVRGR